MVNEELDRFFSTYIEDPGEPSAFTAFMAAYPKKENRDGALKEWWKIRPGLELEAKIMRAVKALKHTDLWIGGFAPNAKNFLRDRRWRDAEELAPEPKRVAATVERPVRGPETPLSTPQSAKAALRQGLIEGWKKDHPDTEPPAALLSDPIGFVTNGMRSL